MKYFSTTTLLCFLFLAASAQTYWETYEDSGFIYNSSITHLSSDAAGNIYSYGTQPTELYTTGFYLDKKDEDGNVLWKLDVPYSVILYMHTTPAGITFLLSEVFIAPVSAWDDKEYTIYAYDTDGDLIWQKLLSMPLYDFESMNEKSMAVDKAGNIAVAVHVFNQDEEPGHLEEVEDAQLYIAKIKGTNGAVLKQTLHDILLDLDETYLEFLKVDTKGNIYLYIDEEGDNFSMYKYNTLLTQVWAKEMGDYLPREILVDKNKFLYLIHEITQVFVFDSVEVRKYDAFTGDNIYVSSTPVLLFDGITSSISLVYSYLDKAGNPIIPYIFDGDGPVLLPCLLKLDGSDGSAAFHIQISTSAPGDVVNPETNKIGIGPLNEIIVGGSVETSYDVLTPICFKYSKTGIKIWEHAVPEDPDNDKILRPVYTYTGTGQLVMGGQFSTPDFYNARYTVSFNGNLTERLAAAEIVPEQEDIITLFPNPAAEYIQLQSIADIKIKRVNTYTTNGNRVNVKFDESWRAEVKQLPSGIYISEIITEEEKIIKKWVKQ